MPLSLGQIVDDFALAFKAVDAAAPQGTSKTRTYKPGIGPLREAEAVQKALSFLQSSLNPFAYASAAPQLYPSSRQLCDMVLPGEWAIEFKLIRPFGDNGVIAEHWSENILHPYAGNVSSIGDCIKLCQSGFGERKAIIVFGYEHTPPQADLRVAVSAFEVTAQQVVGIRLGPRCEAQFSELIHPVHQQGKVFGWELLGYSCPDLLGTAQGTSIPATINSAGE